MARYDVFCSYAVTHYGRFAVEAASVPEALAAARNRIRSAAPPLRPSYPEGAFDLRIIAIRTNGRITFVADDPIVSPWPGRGLREALVSTSLLLGRLILSLGELDAYGTVLDQLAANLGLLGSGGREIMARRGERSTEAWLDEALNWFAAARTP